MVYEIKMKNILIVMEKDNSIFDIKLNFSKITFN